MDWKSNMYKETLSSIHRRYFERHLTVELQAKHTILTLLST
jgi:hypothetical protein